MAVNVASFSFHHSSYSRVLTPTRSKHNAGHKVYCGEDFVEYLQPFYTAIAHAYTTDDIISIYHRCIQLIIIKEKGRSTLYFAALQRRDNQDAIIIIGCFIISAGTQRLACTGLFYLQGFQQHRCLKLANLISQRHFLVRYSLFMRLRVKHIYKNDRSAIIQRKLTVNNLAQSIFFKVLAKAKLLYSLCIAIAQDRFIDRRTVTR